MMIIYVPLSYLSHAAAGTVVQLYEGLKLRVKLLPAFSLNKAFYLIFMTLNIHGCYLVLHYTANVRI